MFNLPNTALKQPKTYYDLKGCKARISVHQGGSRSGKTYSCIQVLAEWCAANPDAGWTISVVRKTFPSLRGSVLRDFVEVLTSQGWYTEANHNKTEQTYNLFGTLWEFISVDTPERIRGRKRNICYINECNELSRDEYYQLAMRTTHKMIIDYNPSMEYSYIYDELIPRPDCNFYRSTYLDNPFLNEETIKEIEHLKNTDENYWRVFGLGLKGISRETIFVTDTYKERPPQAKLVAYGLDFGYATDPTAVVAVYTLGDKQGDLYLEEVLYKGGLTNQDIAHELREAGLTRQDTIIADSAEPKSIEELHREGFNIKPAKKGPDSVRAGIDIMRRRKLFVHAESINTQKEFRNYKWKTDKDGRMLGTPVDLFNHGVDAVRYVCLNKLSHKTGQYVIA